MGQGYSHGEDQSGVRRQRSAKKPGPDVSLVRTAVDNPSTKRRNAILLSPNYFAAIRALAQQHTENVSFQFFSLRQIILISLIFMELRGLDPGIGTRHGRTKGLPGLPRLGAGAI